MTYMNVEVTRDKRGGTAPVPVLYPVLVQIHLCFLNFYSFFCFFIFFGVLLVGSCRHFTGRIKIRRKYIYKSLQLHSFLKKEVLRQRSLFYFVARQK